MGRKKTTSYKAMLLSLGHTVGYKGYGLGFAVDILTGILTGEGRSTAGLKTRIAGNNGIFIVCINIGSITSVDRFKREVDALYRAVKNVPLRLGFKEILIPGERSTRTERVRKEEDVNVPEDTWKEIYSIAQELKLDVEKILDTADL